MAMGTTRGNALHTAPTRLSVRVKCGGQARSYQAAQAQDSERASVRLIQKCAVLGRNNGAPACVGLCSERSSQLRKLDHRGPEETAKPRCLEGFGSASSTNWISAKPFLSSYVTAPPTMLFNDFISSRQRRAPLCAGPLRYVDGTRVP